MDDWGGKREGAHQGLKKSAIVAVVHTNGRRTAQLSRPVVSVGVLSIVWWCLLSLDLKGKKNPF